MRCSARQTSCCGERVQCQGLFSTLDCSDGLQHGPLVARHVIRQAPLAGAKPGRAGRRAIGKEADVGAQQSHVRCDGVWPVMRSDMRWLQ